jgi:hypothetical protein
MTVVPAATPVTGTLPVVWFAPITTVAGTVATPAFDELRLMVNPPEGAGPVSEMVKF